MHAAEIRGGTAGKAYPLLVGQAGTSIARLVRPSTWLAGVLCATVVALLPARLLQLLPCRCCCCPCGSDILPPLPLMQLWQELEQASGEQLLRQHGLLFYGDADTGKWGVGSRPACLFHAPCLPGGRLANIAPCMSLLRRGDGGGQPWHCHVARG